MNESQLGFPSLLLFIDEETENKTEKVGGKNGGSEARRGAARCDERQGGELHERNCDSRLS